MYDERWGVYLNPTHERCVRRIALPLPRGARLIDADCGTGKYWPVLLGAGLTIVGTDQSQAMLDLAPRQAPRRRDTASGSRSIGGIAASAPS